MFCRSKQAESIKTVVLTRVMGRRLQMRWLGKCMCVWGLLRW